MAAVVRQAHEHLQRGMDLGSRRAYFSARAEFVHALRRIAEGLDVESRSNQHSRALADGLRALEESDDFLPSAAELEVDLNVGLLAAVHQTPVVRMSAEEVPPIVARQLYYSYAQERLAESMGKLAAGSAALSALGKLYATTAREPSADFLAAEAKALVLQQAALSVDSRNAAAANELGVLLARLGRYDEALAWLQHSVSLSPQPATWHNLAVVHEHLGQPQLALRARQHQAATPLAQKQAGSRPEVRWVSPRAFATAAAPSPADSAEKRLGNPARQPHNRTSPRPASADANRAPAARVPGAAR